MLQEAKDGYETVVQQLINTGTVDIDSKDLDGQTPLSWAARNGHEAISQQLVNTGAVDIDSEDVDHRTPFS